MFKSHQQRYSIYHFWNLLELDRKYSDLSPNPPKCLEDK